MFQNADQEGRAANKISNNLKELSLMNMRRMVKLLIDVPIMYL